MSQGKRWGWAAVAFVAMVVGARVAAPYLLLDYVNDTLAGLDGYTGRVDDIDLDLWRGSYRIEGTHIRVTDAEVEEPFLVLPRTEISVQWSALMDGAIVAAIDLYEPEMRFIATRSSATTVHAKQSENWQDQVKRLTPLRINRVQFHDGELHFRNPHSKPHVDIYLSGANVVIENLTNSRHLSRSLQARLTADATVMGSGALHLEGRVDPYAEKTTFDVRLKLKSLDLTELNDFTRAYANVDLERGSLELYADIRAQDGQLSGYAKPFVDDLKVLRWKEEEENLVGKLWETVVGGAAELFENQLKDSSATKIPLSGSVDSPEANVWLTLVGVLKHAFLGALDRELEG